MYGEGVESQNSSIAEAVCVNIKSIFSDPLAAGKCVQIKAKQSEEARKDWIYGFLRANLDMVVWYHCIGLRIGIATYLSESRN